MVVFADEPHGSHDGRDAADCESSLSLVGFRRLVGLTCALLSDVCASQNDGQHGSRAAQRDAANAGTPPLRCSLSCAWLKRPAAFHVVGRVRRHAESREAQGEAAAATQRKAEGAARLNHGHCLSLKRASPQFRALSCSSKKLLMDLVAL